MRNPGEDPFDSYATAVTPNIKFEVPGFRIIGELGRGAFGVVYHAHDIALERAVAIKVALVDDPARRDEYIQEAQKAAKLSIDGVVPVYQVGRLTNGMPFVVQMLLEGGTLRQEMKRLGGISPKRVCDLLIRVAQVVAQAHAAGLVHRDLKPDNILLDARGQPWVADFGLALSESEQRKHKGEKAGTPIYMSPEQIQGRAEWLDGRSDIYALGVIFYELLVGRPPYSASTRQELEEQILYRDPKPLTQYLTGAPSEFDLIFSKCCAKQIKDRYGNAMDLVRDLTAVHQLMSYSDVQLIGSARAGHASTSGGTSIDTIRRYSTLLTAREEAPRSVPLLIIWLAIGVSVLGAIAYGAANYTRLFADRGSASGNAEPESEEPQPATSSDRPQILHVSKDPNSKIKTIAEAIKQARPGESIFIGSGKYEENLVLSKDVLLIGDANARPIIGALQTGDTLVVTDGARVVLRHLNLDNVNKEANTIHVKLGSITVEHCTVFASSYNCVKALPSSTVKLNNSVFRNGAHEAVYVEGLKSFDVEGCTFEINPSSFGGGAQQPYGIQARNCSGRIAGSTFNERGQRGVYWKDATGPVILENNQFDSCDYPIQLDNVGLGTIQGETTMVDCKNGIVLQDSSVSIRGLKIRGTRKLASSGIRIHTQNNNPDQVVKLVSVADSEIVAFEQGLEVIDKSVELSLDKVTFLKNETCVNLKAAKKATLKHCEITQSMFGMLLIDSTAWVNDCAFNEVKFGITQSSPSEDRGLMCEASRFQSGGSDSAALVLKSGVAEFKDSTIQSMGQAFLFESSANAQSTRKLDIRSVSVSDCGHGLLARAPGVVTVDTTDLGIDMRKDRFSISENPAKTFSIIARDSPP